MKFFTNNSNDPYYNLALEEYVTRTAVGEVFLLWRNGPTVVIGRNQNPNDELDVAAAREQNVNIARRMSGGGAVYHDLGNVNFSYISQNTAGFGDFMAFARPVVAFLRSLGVEAEHIGNNDIGVDGRKISGNAQYISGGNILHHGTLLFDTDLQVLSGLLTPDPAKLENKGIASVRSRVANIGEFTDMSREEFWRRINEHFSAYEPFTAIDEAAVRELRDSKYATDDWNFGQSPQFDRQ